MEGASAELPHRAGGNRCGAAAPRLQWDLGVLAAAAWGRAACQMVGRNHRLRRGHKGQGRV